MTLRVRGIISAKHYTRCILPLYNSCVSAGYPSFVDEQEDILDLHELLVLHPEATFFVRVSGSSMIDAGIHHGDILVVDRSLEPVHGKIVIAAINGELTVKRLYRQNGCLRLVAENTNHPCLEVTNEQELHIWGVVTSVIHRV